MPAINYNFIVEQGSEFELNFQYNDKNGKGVSLVDPACVIMQYITSNPPKTGVFSSRDNSSLYSLVATTSGLVTLKLTSDITTSLNDAIYDLDLLNLPEGNPKNLRLATGNITVQKRNTSVPTCSLTQSSISNNIVVVDLNTLKTQSSSLSSSEKQSLLDYLTNQISAPSVTPTPTGSQEDFCLETDCLNIDIYSKVFYGSGLNINDMSLSSGSINVSSTGLIENVELVIDKLSHTNPQDLQLMLAPPSGSKILLSANHKLSTSSANNFSFMFSNRANPTKYLHNVPNGGLCNIYNKTSYVKYNNETLLSSFGHLFNNNVPTGLWTLYARDTDPVSSGTINGWKLIITYK